MTVTAATRDMSCWRFGALWSRSEARQLLTGRLARPSGAAALVLLLGWLAVTVTVLPLVRQGYAGLGQVLIVGVGVVLVLFWWIMQGLVGVLAWRRAQRRWVVRSEVGVGAATAVPAGGGGWKLVCVVAQPTGCGLGRQLMTAVTETADLSSARLELDAVNGAAARFYSRWGFRPARRRMWSLDWLQGRRMERSPRSSSQAAPSSETRLA